MSTLKSDIQTTSQARDRRPSPSTRARAGADSSRDADRPAQGGHDVRLSRRGDPAGV